MNTSTLVTAPLGVPVGVLVGVVEGLGDVVVADGDGAVVVADGDGDVVVAEGDGAVVVADGDDDVVVVGRGLAVVADEPVLTSRAGGVLDSRDPSRRLVDEGVSTMRVTAPFAGTGQA